jgi:DNA-binding IclR family transcriptional regulator
MLLNLLIEVEADVVRRPRGVAIQQVANELGVHKSTASRLMRSLVAQGYAVPNPGSPRGFRLRGYALDDEENDPGVRCISAPVFNALGEAIGCAGIDGPSVRMTEDRLDGLAASVVAAAERLSASMRTRVQATAVEIAAATA